MSKTVVVAGLPYSPNVGDGLISDALLASIQQPNNNVKVLDISGRTEFGRDVSNKRDWLIGIFQRSPGWVSRAVMLCVYFLKLRQILQEHYKIGLQGADILFIGGGQLISDRALNFPLKIFLLAKIAKKLGIPYGFVAVGVSNNFSYLGRRLLESAFSNAKFISVRDELSFARLEVVFPGNTPSIVYDPVLPSKTNIEIGIPNRPLMVGVNIINPRLAQYSSTGDFKMTATEYRAGVIDLVSRLCESGYGCTLFCNGDVSDFETQGEIAKALSEKGVKFDVLDRPIKPSDLKAHISRLNVLVGWRLHACISALAAGIPAIGLSWDAKLRSLFVQYRAEEQFVESNVGFPEVVIDAVNELVAQGSIRYTRKETTRAVFDLGDMISRVVK